MPYLVTNTSAYNAPFNGMGNVHYQIPQLNNGDNRYYINRNYYPTDGFIRDPER